MRAAEMSETWTALKLVLEKLQMKELEMVHKAVVL